MIRLQRIDLAIYDALGKLQMHGEKVDAGHWQGVPTEGRPDMQTKELINLTIETPIPETIERLTELVRPNIPWAENHFQERVSRVPSNPGEEYANWPWWRGQTEETMPGGKFTHTYQERFWPKKTSEPSLNRYGIRYDYGDLDDVVELLRAHPNTRQATFPIFFPEDTGAVHGGRVPCTLHYHFMRRAQYLHMWYPIRSCDAVRHFRDDIYMACRLCQWVIQELRNGDNDYPGQQLWEETRPGTLFFTAYSFHLHMGDAHLL